MSVNIDRVYQKVLALANKEQRGYITPQEFNLFADHAQMEIFEQYFYDLEQFERNPSSDVDDFLEQKISAFEKYDQVAVLSVDFGDVQLPSNVYKLGMVRVDYDTTSGFVPAEHVQLKELHASISPLTKWNKSRPVYIMISSSSGGSRLRVYPYPVPPERVLLSYVLKPNKPNWAYVISNENALYNSSNSIDFELHSSEENKLVIKILALAGVAIKDVQLAQVAAGKEASITQQQKQ